MTMADLIDKYHEFIAGIIMILSISISLGMFKSKYYVVVKQIVKKD